MTKTDTIPCSKCGAQIPPEDFSQGLAVQDQGQSICKICVDGGADSNSPPAPRQPLMQQNIYRFSHDDFDYLNRFTFLTAGHIALHRRVEREQGAFNPPELDEHNSQETRILTARQAKKTTRRETPLSQQQQTSPANKNIMLIGGIAAAIIIIGVAAFVLTNGEPVQHTPPTNSVQTTESEKKSRSDFPDHAISAWNQASQELDDNNAVLLAIRDEVIKEQSQILNKAASLIEAKDSSRAHSFLEKTEIPQHSFFNDLKNRKALLIEQRNLLIAGTHQTSDDTPPRKSHPENTTTKDLTPISFATTLQLSSGITRSTNLIGNDVEMGLAQAFNCSNDNIGHYHSYTFKSGGYIAINKNTTYPHAFSLSFFFRLDPETSSDIQWLLSHGALNSEDSVNIYVSQGYVRTVIGFNPTDSLEVSPQDFAINDGNWHNYTLIANKENGASVFLDGKLQCNNGSISGPLKPSGPLLLGANNDKQRNLLGGLALINFYNGSDQDKLLSTIQEIFSEIRKAETNVAQKEFDFSPITTVALKPLQSSKDASSLSSPTLLGSWTKKGITTTALGRRNIKNALAQDYDNDGDWDIIGISEIGRFIFENDSTGKFTYKSNDLWASNTEIKASKLTELRTSDMNNDGLLDIIEFSPDENGIHIFINIGDGTYKPHKIAHDVNRSRQRSGTADFNNDGRPDLFFQLKNNGSYMCVFNPGVLENSQEWPFVTFEAEKDKPIYEKCVVHDFNNDEYLDILFITTNPGSYVLFINNKDRSFSKTEIPMDNLPSFNGFRTYMDQGHAKVLANVDNNHLAFLNFKDQTFTLSDPVFEFVTLKDNKNNGLMYYLRDLNDDGTSDFIHLNRSYKIAISSKDQTSASLTEQTQIRDQEFCAADYNGDGYLDLCHISARHNKSPNVVLYLRNPDYNEPNIDNINDQNDTTKTPSIDPENISYPVILSRLEADGRSKYINIYNEGIDRNSEQMLYVTSPMINGDYREVLDPYALEARARGRECSVTIEVDKRDASNGGIALVLHPMDKERKNIAVIITDSNKVSTPVLTAELTGNDWQIVCFDLSNVSDEFDASSISEIEIKDLPDTSSIAFLVHRLLFYRDHVPSTESIAIKPGLAPNQITFNTDKVVKARIKKEKVVILLHQELYDKSDYALELRREISSITGEPLDADHVMLLGSDTTWVANNYRKSILKKKKPQFVIAVGAGNNLNKDPDHQENLTFWKAFIQTTKEEAIPIICFGPHPGHSPGTKAWKPLIDGLNKFKAANRASLVDMTQIPYITNGRFGRNLKEQSIKDICRAYYQTLAQIGAIEEP